MRYGFVGMGMVVGFVECEWKLCHGTMSREMVGLGWRTLGVCVCGCEFLSKAKEMVADRGEIENVEKD